MLKPLRNSSLHPIPSHPLPAYVNPIVLEYSPTCSECTRFLPLFKEVAEQYPQRQFFLANRDQMTEDVQWQCLSLSGHDFVPRTLAYFRADQANDTAPTTIGQGELSKNELIWLSNSVNPNSNVATSAVKRLY